MDVNGQRVTFIDKGGSTLWRMTFKLEGTGMVRIEITDALNRYRAIKRAKWDHTLETASAVYKRVALDAVELFFEAAAKVGNQTDKDPVLIARDIDRIVVNGHDVVQVKHPVIVGVDPRFTVDGKYASVVKTMPYPPKGLASSSSHRPLPPSEPSASKDGTPQP